MISEKIDISHILPPFSLKYRCFDDAASFHQNLRLFDVDIWQLSEGKFQGHLIEAASEQVQIDHHCHNRLLKIEGSPTVNWAFGIPAYPLCLLFEQKYLLDDSYILISPPRSGFTMIQKSAYGLYVIYFTETFFDHLCQEYSTFHVNEVQSSRFEAGGRRQGAGGNTLKCTSGK